MLTPAPAGRFLSSLWFAAVLLNAGCGDGTTSSSGPTEHAGSYIGTVSVGGATSPLRITITPGGSVMMQSPGGVVCAGDLPESIGLDDDVFSSATNEQCLLGGFPCPVNTSVSGSVSDGTITGSGQVLAGCPGAPVQPVVFTFIAREE